MQNSPRKRLFFHCVVLLDGSFDENFAEMFELRHLKNPVADVYNAFRQHFAYFIDLTTLEGTSVDSIAEDVHGIFYDLIVAHFSLSHTNCTISVLMFS